MNWKQVAVCLVALLSGYIARADELADVKQRIHRGWSRRWESHSVMQYDLVGSITVPAGGYDKVQAMFGTVDTSRRYPIGDESFHFEESLYMNMVSREAKVKYSGKTWNARTGALKDIYQTVSLENDVVTLHRPRSKNPWMQPTAPELFVHDRHNLVNFVRDAVDLPIHLGHGLSFMESTLFAPLASDAIAGDFQVIVPTGKNGDSVEVFGTIVTGESRCEMIIDLAKDAAIRAATVYRQQNKLLHCEVNDFDNVGSLSYPRKWTITQYDGTGNILRYSTVEIVSRRFDNDVDNTKITSLGAEPGAQSGNDIGPTYSIARHKEGGRRQLSRGITTSSLHLVLFSVTMVCGVVYAIGRRNSQALGVRYIGLVLSLLVCGTVAMGFARMGSSHSICLDECDEGCLEASEQSFSFVEETCLSTMGSLATTGWFPDQLVEVDSHPESTSNDVPIEFEMGYRCPTCSLHMTYGEVWVQGDTAFTIPYQTDVTERICVPD